MLRLIPSRLAAALTLPWHSASAWRMAASAISSNAPLAGTAGAVGPQLLPADVRAGTSTAPAVPASGAVEEIAEAAMRQALAECQGNVSAAAKRLGINRSTLYRRLGTPRG